MSLSGKGKARPAPAAPARTAPAAPAGEVPPAWSAMVGLAALAFYVFLAPTVGGEGDANELTLVLAVGGVPHPTGYPLYTLLGHAFVSALHAVGAGWWFAANAWSAVGAALALGFLHALAARLAGAAAPLSRRTAFLVALAPVLLVALNPTWVVEATLAEVNSWHAAWAAGACLAAHALLRRVLGEAPPRPGRAGLVWGLVCGAGLAHHLTAVLFIVPLTAVLFWGLVRARRSPGAFLAGAAAGALVPLATYGYVFYRAFHPAPYQWPQLEPSVAGVLAHLRGGQFGMLLGHFAPSETQQAQIETTIYPFLYPGLVLLLLGSLRAGGAADRAFVLAAAVAALFQGVFVLNYGAVDPGTYFLAPLLVALLAVPLWGAGLAARPATRLAAGIVALGAAVALGVVWAGAIPRRHQRLVRVEALVRAAWEQVPFRHGVIFWSNDMYTRLRAYQLLDGEKTDLYVENPGVLTWPAGRAAFRRRFGFDPLAGVALRADADLARVADNVGARTNLPTADFDELLRVAAERTGIRP
jgi:hypothetical protein